ncbi:MAG TPA: Rieske 2Fe-2S domain-containing protein [Methylomirabilota bacterium]|nr:Rieske 2Fe-2S domain-containing protein [Methylomirabilota bacterium]
MLSREDNELLCRIGPGTPMGALMRQYWVPAALSSELPETDGPPLRVRLLGEDLIAFRVSSGAVGLIQNACPHRGASLFYGRNEAEGLRCVYHGWKFDVTGCCVDMPSEPAESSFKHKVKAVAYPCVERAGLIWAYLGPRQTPPAMPDLEPIVGEGSTIQIYQRECNWMQALEGDIDTGHTVFLHLGGVAEGDVPPGTWSRYALSKRAPRYEVVETDFGVMYGACRPAEADTNYWRIANFLFPFYAMVPTGVLGLEVRVRAWVPMDDDHTLAITISRGQPPQSRNAGRQVVGPPETLPNTTDWYGRFRCVADAGNDYLIDRKSQKAASYTGIGSIFLQDQAVTESMGPIYNRTQEHLATSDTMVIRTRKRLIDAARALRDQGQVPPGVDAPAVYRVRSGGVVLPRDADWIEATKELRRAWAEHPGLSRSVLGGLPAV